MPGCDALRREGGANDNDETTVSRDGWATRRKQIDSLFALVESRRRCYRAQFSLVPTPPAQNY